MVWDCSTQNLWWVNNATDSDFWRTWRTARYLAAGEERSVLLYQCCGEFCFRDVAAGGFYKCSDAFVMFRRLLMLFVRAWNYVTTWNRLSSGRVDAKCLQNSAFTLAECTSRHAHCPNTREADSGRYIYKSLAVANSWKESPRRKCFCLQPHLITWHPSFFPLPEVASGRHLSCRRSIYNRIYKLSLVFFFYDDVTTQRSGEDCITKSFMLCIPHQISFGWWNQDWDGQGM